MESVTGGTRPYFRFHQLPIVHRRLFFYSSRLNQTLQRQGHLMAGYRQHIGFSGLLGVIYGTAATMLFGFSPVQGTIAFLLTWFAGMLPDIDSQTGRPVQEIFGVICVLGPLILMQHLTAWGGDPERIFLLVILFYILIRNFGAPLLGKLAVHRGMYHSIPALLIVSLLTFLYYKHDEWQVRTLMALGVGLGFLSHLVLDEIYSVQWTGTKLKLAKSAGSAMKWFGHSVPANAFCWAAVMFLSYMTLVDLGLVVESDISEQSIEQQDEPISLGEEGSIENAVETPTVDLGDAADSETMFR